MIKNESLPPSSAIPRDTCDCDSCKATWGYTYSSTCCPRGLSHGANCICGTSSLPSSSASGVSDELSTECCDVEIQPGQRFCPKCGWEARLRPSIALPAPVSSRRTWGNPMKRSIWTQKELEKLVRRFVDETGQQDYQNADIAAWAKVKGYIMPVPATDVELLAQMIGAASTDDPACPAVAVSVG